MARRAPLHTNGQRKKGVKQCHCARGHIGIHEPFERCVHMAVPGRGKADRRKFANPFGAIHVETKLNATAGYSLRLLTLADTEIVFL